MFGRGRKTRESERVYIVVWCCEKSHAPHRVGLTQWWTFRIHGEDFTIQPDECSETSAAGAAAAGRALCERLGLRVTDIEFTSDEQNATSLDSE